MLEEPIDILLCTGLLAHYPREPHVLGIRILNGLFAIIHKVPKGVICPLNLGVQRAVNPQRVVIDAQFEATGFALGHEIGK